MSEEPQLPARPPVGDAGPVGHGSTESRSFPTLPPTTKTPASKTASKPPRLPTMESGDVTVSDVPTESRRPAELIQAADFPVPIFAGSESRSTPELRISETFTSRQGEGQLTGTSSFFIRTSGCNLRCWFCDTPYASWDPQGKRLDVDQLVTMAAASGTRHVVLTGGEPLVPPAIAALSDALKTAGFHITVETAGTVDRVMKCDLMSISPKLASSAPSAETHPQWHRRHQQRRMPTEIMRRLIDRAADFQVKFVVDSTDDYAELHDIVDRLGVPPDSVWIMPQGSTVDAMDRAQAWLEPWTTRHGFRYCDRLQIRWFGNRRGT